MINNYTAAGRSIVDSVMIRNLREKAKGEKIGLLVGICVLIGLMLISSSDGDGK